WLGCGSSHGHNEHSEESQDAMNVNPSWHLHRAAPKRCSKSRCKDSRPATIVRRQWISHVDVSLHVASAPDKRYACHRLAPADHADPSESCVRIAGVSGANHRPSAFDSSQP